MNSVIQNRVDETMKVRHQLLEMMVEALKNENDDQIEAILYSLQSTSNTLAALTAAQELEGKSSEGEDEDIKVFVVPRRLVDRLAGYFGVEEGEINQVVNDCGYIYEG